MAHGDGEMVELAMAHYGRSVARVTHSAPRRIGRRFSAAFSCARAGYFLLLRAGRLRKKALSRRRAILEFADDAELDAKPVCAAIAELWAIALAMRCFF